MAPSRVRIPPSPLAQRPPRFCAHPRRGGRAVECGGLENRYPSLGGSRVQIPPPPPPQPVRDNAGSCPTGFHLSSSPRWPSCCSTLPCSSSAAGSDEIAGI